MLVFYNYFVVPLQTENKFKAKLANLWPNINGFLTPEEEFNYEITTAKLQNSRVQIFTPVIKTMPSLSLSRIKRTSLNATFSLPIFNKFDVNATIRLTPVLTLTTPTILAFAGVDFKFRYSSIAQILFAQALRRSLLLMRNFKHHIFLKGTIPGFGPLWRRVNAANNEYYLDFYTNTWIYDISVTNSRQRTLKSFTAQVKNSITTAAALIEEDQTPEPLDEIVANTAQFFLNQSNNLPSAKRLYRYSFEWASLLVVLKNPHGYVKKKKIRSIKKRLVKKIVSTAQRRVWVV